MRRFAILVVAAGLLVWAAAPALSTEHAVPTAVDFRQELDVRGTVARAAGGTWTSGTLTAPKRFDLVGLRWGGEREETDVEIRTRRDGGDWSPWVKTGRDSGPRASDPVWAGGADEYQLRMSRRPPKLRAFFVNTTGTSSFADRARKAVRGAVRGAVVALVGGDAAAQGNTPQIVPREAWGAQQCQPRAEPSYGRVDLGAVHHTVSTNEYGPEDSAAIVLAICRYHRNSNGWNDVGYNLLVDRFGQVFEGRAGGLDQPVVGAQMAGYNSVSTGIANIGTFSGVPQTPAGVQAVGDLLAWKLPLHGAPIEGQVAAGSKVFERISGHRDGNDTECPGQALYDQLPDIRRRAAERAPAFARAAVARLDIELAQRAVTYPDPARFSGRLLAPDGSPVGGQQVSIQIEGADGFRTVQTTTTGADGTWAADLGSAWDRNVRAIADVPGSGRVTSRRRTVLVGPLVEARARRRLEAGDVLVVRGAVRPVKSSVRVLVARKGDDGRYRTEQSVATRVRDRAYAKGVRLRRPGLYRIRVTTRADRRNGAGRSRSLFVRAAR